MLREKLEHCREASFFRLTAEGLGRLHLAFGDAFHNSSLKQEAKLRLTQGLSFLAGARTAEYIRNDAGEQPEARLNIVWKTDGETALALVRRAAVRFATAGIVSDFQKISAPGTTGWMPWPRFSPYIGVPLLVSALVAGGGAATGYKPLSDLGRTGLGIATVVSETAYFLPRQAVTLLFGQSAGNWASASVWTDYLGITTPVAGKTKELTPGLTSQKGTVGQKDV